MIEPTEVNKSIKKPRKTTRVKKDTEPGAPKKPRKTTRVKKAPVSKTEETVVPSTEETVVPSTEETVVPSTEETVVPKTEETVVPSTEETVVPKTEETVVPSTEETDGPSTEETPIITNVMEMTITENDKINVIMDSFVNNQIRELTQIYIQDRHCNNNELGVLYIYFEKDKVNVKYYPVSHRFVTPELKESVLDKNNDQNSIMFMLLLNYVNNVGRLVLNDLDK